MMAEFRRFGIIIIQPIILANHPLKSHLQTIKLHLGQTPIQSLPSQKISKI